MNPFMRSDSEKFGDLFRVRHESHGEGLLSHLCDDISDSVDLPCLYDALAHQTWTRELGISVQSHAAITHAKTRAKAHAKHKQKHMQKQCAKTHAKSHANTHAKTHTKIHAKTHTNLFVASNYDMTLTHDKTLITVLKL